MAVAVGGGQEAPMSDINTTPLVDVMLVLLIIFLIAVPIALQQVAKLHIPIMPSTESKEKVENLLLTVSTTDAGGRNAGEPGFEGAYGGGECRVYLNGVTPVDSTELAQKAFDRLDSVIKRNGGVEAVMANHDLIPQVHIRADKVAPWRCVAGAIYNVQVAGFPTVGFISNPVDPNG
jgi:biopolymer transport protein ExbD